MILGTTKHNNSELNKWRTKMNKRTNKELAKNNQFSEIAPAYVDTKSKRGNETIGVDDILVPRLALCQALSPQRKKSSDSYIEGIEEGDFFNTVTGELYGNSVNLVSILYRKEFLVWVDRETNSKGGFRGSYPTLAEANHFVATQDDADSLEVAETGINFCLLIAEDGTTSQVTTAMAKSAMKVSKKWNSLVVLAGGDRFSRAYKLSSIEAQGAKGDYFNYDVQPLGFVSESVYKEAEQAFIDLSEAAVTTNHQGD
jgi:hypothetical protein